MTGLWLKPSGHVLNKEIKNTLSEEKLKVTHLEVSKGSCTEMCAVCDTKLFPSISSFLTLLHDCCW